MLSLNIAIYGHLLLLQMPGSVSPNILLAAVRIVVIVAMLVFESSVFLDREYSFFPKQYPQRGIANLKQFRPLSLAPYWLSQRRIAATLCNNIPQDSPKSETLNPQP